MNQAGVAEAGNPLQALTKLLFGADMKLQVYIVSSRIVTGASDRGSGEGI
jgi:hypothetical protein